MDKRETVCAVVVTYNRKALLIKCIEALLAQTRTLDGIYIIDNASADGTPELLREKGYVDSTSKEFSIFYVRMPENMGGSGGFYEGIKRAYEEGYDWIWVMDDDAFPKSDALEVLLRYDDENVAALCPLIVHAANNMPECYHHKRINKYFIQRNVDESELKKNKVIEINANAFVGPMIKRTAIKDAGFPEHKYFIYGDDVEYIYRISRKGRVLLIAEAVIFHRDELFDDNNKYLVTWKKFYGLRNNLAFAKKNKNAIGMVFFTVHYLKTFLKAFFVTLILKRDPAEAMVIAKYSYYSLYEGVSGNFNKYFPIERIYVRYNKNGASSI